MGREQCKDEVAYQTSRQASWYLASRTATVPWIVSALRPLCGLTCHALCTLRPLGGSIVAFKVPIHCWMV